MINQPGQPLVSCIMPTYNRRPFVAHAIWYFQRQEYGNKELIILDDGTDSVQDLVPEAENIHYFRLDKKLNLGAKLNLACSYAKGELIANWDDDDWYAERRLQYQVDALIREPIDVCGINNLLYYDLRNKLAYRYVYPVNQRTWLLGSSLCYTRELWNRNRFAEINVGMDGLFVWGTPSERVRALPDETISVHMIHDNNVSPKKVNDGWWHQFPVSGIREIINTDWPFYNNGDTPARPNGTPVKPTVTPTPPARPPRSGPFTNVFACLVHEGPDCIIDLVRNLHYQDPSSIILLYNGGEDKDLLGGDFPFDQYGAVIHPDPIPVKHGYLHPFALRSMEYALEKYTFDTLTIVDSDQLCIRPGYTACLEKFFETSPGTGMLSSMPARVTADNRNVYTAIQAFKEYELWRPFISNFPQGEQKFVHWTFWPSTVFTKDACHDLTKIFRENRQLQQIMQQTKIWATEEIILPTLVRLMGYEITGNPCSYDFVKYKQTYSLPEINQALDKRNAYWIHPIERKYEEPLRQHVRRRFDQYKAARAVPADPGSALTADAGNTGSGNTSSGNTDSGNTGSGNTGLANTGFSNSGTGNSSAGKTGSPNTGTNSTDSGKTGSGKKGQVERIPPPDLFQPLALINSLKKIEGWLEDREADLLMAITIRICKKLSPSDRTNIVEIGSFQGKSTVLLGSTVKAFAPQARVYAIDPHDGIVGAIDQGIIRVPPSFEILKKNIDSAGITAFVEIIRDRSVNVKWQKPVALLLIDGLHDYPSVAKDFWHFSYWLETGGHICFHDYAEYYPGVKVFVDELLMTGRYREIARAGSLIIIQKL